MTDWPFDRDNPIQSDVSVFWQYLKDLQLLQHDLLTLTVFSGQMDGLQHEAGV